ncbi:hypothetical protein Tco_1382001 [Tanacetum coccineum]
MTRASSKKLKTGDVAVDVEAPSHSPIPEVQAEVPSQETTVEIVAVPPNIAFKAHPTVSFIKKIGTKKKRLGRKGVHTSHSTIPIEEGDPDAEHKLCIKYASDKDSAFDCDTPVHLYAVVDWELLSTGLGSINAIYRLDNSRKYFTSLKEILHLVTRADLMTIYGRVMTFYQDNKAEGVGLVLSGDLQILMDSPEVNDGNSGLVIHIFVDKQYPLSVNLIKRMIDHKLEICHGTVGNELTTAFKIGHQSTWIMLLLGTTDWLVKATAFGKDLTNPLIAANLLKIVRYLYEEIKLCVDISYVQVKTQADWILPSKFIVQSSRYVVPTGRVVVPAGSYIVPAGKVIIIVSTGRLSLVPTGRVLNHGRVK